MSSPDASFFQVIVMVAMIAAAFARGNLPAVLIAVAVVLASLLLLKYRNGTSRIRLSAISRICAKQVSLLVRSHPLLPTISHRP